MQGHYKIRLSYFIPNTRYQLCIFYLILYVVFLIKCKLNEDRDSVLLASVSPEFEIALGI